MYFAAYLECSSRNIHAWQYGMGSCPSQRNLPNFHIPFFSSSYKGQAGVLTGTSTVSSYGMGLFS